ncbi:hypothetical protein GGTG_11579 [Gaeumannomyces tritici R3-111a-1]|uniref:Uncharacterized protein n=1 Tax=Gaeumannomyces tritici (strain R3-111a-1) TaxID=644352 RepID=J3PDK6_GAET3|nr:hypothetical protein GGTG_11579 [Gaeumannomyces tritici R3-111a-1]EJT70556.1 hypothetical protein GGTG_11579 [Gaeumannomyces tritici R3-111a-1]
MLQTAAARIAGGLITTAHLLEAIDEQDRGSPTKPQRDEMEETADIGEMQQHELW